MYVIGTAGHVDHGKSTLVKILTGIDPDRWEEEQRREMTIDLGFAWLSLPSGRSVSIIDVPGHERFIKNMLAGVGGIDAALLVIAADESVMPQTEEHLTILDILDIRHAVVALTKADLIDQEWLGLVREDVRERLSQSTLANAPIVAVSARTGLGLNELLQTLDIELARTPSRVNAQGQPRLAIDRAFTIGGFGTVVTGTLIDGPLQIGDEVEIVTKSLRGRVRGLQSHMQKLSQALPGTRVAVNLAGISHHELARGDVLSVPGYMQPSMLLDAQLRLAAADHNGHVLRQNDRLDVFVGASEVACRLTLLDREALAPGETGWVQLRLEHALAVARGDRYIIRQPSPGRTLGGGQIINPHPARHRRFRSEVSQALAALARGTPTDLLRQALADQHAHSWAELLRASALPKELALEGLATLQADNEVILLGQFESVLPNTWLISTAGWERLREKLHTALAGYHRRYCLRAGMPREELRSRLKLGSEAMEAVSQQAQAEGRIRSVEATVCLADFQPSLTPEQTRMAQRLLDACAVSAYSPPAPDIDADVLAFLIEQRKLLRVSPEVVFVPEAYAQMCTWVSATIEQHGSVTVAAFRDRFATSRKYALALLEHLDERKITKRVGDARTKY